MLSVMGLVPNPPGGSSGGEVLFESAICCRFRPTSCVRSAAPKIGMIFQEPLTSLNPC